MKLKNYAAFAAITLAGVASSHAALTLANSDFELNSGADFNNWTEAGDVQLNSTGGGDDRVKLVGNAASITSDSAGTIALLDVGGTISLSFNLYDPHGGTDPSNSDILVELLFDGATSPGSFATIGRASIEAATDAEALFSIPDYTVQAADQGKAVTVRFTSSNAAEAWHQTGIDDVNLTITAVPEPSSAALLGLGGLALILRRRK